MKIYRIVLTVVAFCLLCTSIITLSMGWLTNVWPAAPALPFSAGNTPDYELYRISYSNENVQSVTDVSSLGSSTSERNDLFANVGENPSLATIDAELQFGTINNLYFLENENYIFYAVKIPAEMGTEVSLGVFNTDMDDDEYHFSIWEETEDDEGNPTGQLALVPNVDENTSDTDTTTLWDKVAAIETACTNAVGATPNGQTFIKYSFALSNQAPGALDTFSKMSALFTDDYPLNNFRADGTPVLSEQTFTGTPTGGFYYLYIKLEPNMPLYKEFIEPLYAHMPFYLSYETRIMLSVRPADSTAS